MEQNAIFFLSFLYTPCCALHSLNCNECAEVVHKLGAGEEYPEIYMTTASTEARTQFLGLRSGRGYLPLSVDGPALATMKYKGLLESRLRLSSYRRQGRAD